MIQLRKATLEDNDFYFALKNDPLVLQGSYVIREAVPYEQYKEWFTKQLSGVDMEFWVIEEDGIPVGDVRLDFGEETELSIRLTEDARGRGIASYSLGLLIDKAMEYNRPIMAYIVDGNIASMRLFLRHGFLPVSYEKGPTIGRYKYVR